jgi:hypothetical protein
LSVLRATWRANRITTATDSSPFLAQIVASQHPPNRLSSTGPSTGSGIVSGEASVPVVNVAAAASFCAGALVSSSGAPAVQAVARKRNAAQLETTNTLRNA